MGNQESSTGLDWEDRFGRRLKQERERRGYTQATVADLLREDYGIDLHPTAIAKMEQRDGARPRAIRLDEACAIAAIFSLTVEEMAASPKNDFELAVKVLEDFAGTYPRSWYDDAERAIDAWHRIRQYLEEGDYRGELGQYGLIASEKVRSLLRSVEYVHQDALASIWSWQRAVPPESPRFSVVDAWSDETTGRE